MDDKKIRVIAEEAAKLLFDNPELTHREAIEKAREMILNEKVETMEKVN